ncbi:MAG TPA: prepilin-type N-terminal cleavage/methylation domain-containing protein [Patescibacteria group bacterium]|nr:prepilin-type N-terminal cleavage/methylation domain-containing protein [Patescibacteria group bacterium]
MTTAQLNLKKLESGFTLIELLIVIGILAVLMGIVLVAINPAKQFASANDTKRRSDVTAILDSIDQYAADNKGSLPTAGTTTIATSTAMLIAKTGTNTIDLCSSLITKYMAALPTDPKNGIDGVTGDSNGSSVTNCANGYNTGYSVQQSATDNRVTVSAVSEVNPGTIISVTR